MAEHPRARRQLRGEQLGSSTVVKMQMAQLAREHSQRDDVTVNVASLKEANKVLAEARLSSQGTGLRATGRAVSRGAGHASVRTGPVLGSH